jgi:putative Mg2+ transporter-C (MgtC) family protein
MMMRPPDLNEWEMLARLALAAGLGAVIGFEREWRDRTAGLRTHMLVCLGSAAFTIVSAYGFRDWYPAVATNVRPAVVGDPTRIAAQIVTGIGFLGAGAIFRSDDGIRGLTTAASLWVMAAIGLAVGAGDYELAVASTALILLVLVALRQVSGRIKRMNREERTELQVVVAGPTEIGQVFEAVSALDGVISDFHAAIVRSGRSKRRLTFQLSLPEDGVLSDVIGRLAMLEGVESVAAPTLPAAPGT